MMRVPSQPVKHRWTEPIGRGQWATVARWVGVILVVIAGSLFFLHPSTSYQGYTGSEQASTVSTQCISPWNEWTGHVEGTTAAGEADVTTACYQAITAREHLAWPLLIVGLLLMVGSFTRRRETVT
jgi:hypothetical protein